MFPPFISTNTFFSKMGVIRPVLRRNHAIKALHITYDTHNCKKIFCCPLKMCQIPYCSPISSFLRGYCNTKNEDLNTKWVRNMQRRLNISRNPPVLISLARNPHFPVTYSSYFSKKSVSVFISPIIITYPQFSIQTRTPHNNNSQILAHIPKFRTFNWFTSHPVLVKSQNDSECLPSCRQYVQNIRPHEKLTMKRVLSQKHHAKQTA